MSGESQSRTNSTIGEGEKGLPSPTAIALDIGGQIAGKVVGAAVGKATGPLLEMLGLGSEGPDFEQYYQGIMSKLSKLEGGITAIQQELASLATELQKVQQGISDIKADIKDVELQAALRNYSNAAAVVDQNFESLTAVLRALGSAPDLKVALSHLHDLFSVTNTDNVAIALRQIHESLIGANELKGIFSFQSEVCRKALDDWAAERSHLVSAASEEEYPHWRGTWIDSCRIVDQAVPLTSETIEAVVVPLFQAASLVRAKGLLFLAAAWSETDLEKNIETPITHARAEMAAIGKFYGDLDLDGIVQQIVRDRSLPLTAIVPDAATKKWGDSGSESIPYPFSDDWRMWRSGSTHEEEIAVANMYRRALGLKEQPKEITRYMVYQPWVFGSCRNAGDISQVSAPPQFQARSPELAVYNWGSEEIERPSTSKKMPLGLAKLIG